MTMAIWKYFDGMWIEMGVFEQTIFFHHFLCDCYYFFLFSRFFLYHKNSNVYANFYKEFLIDSCALFWSYRLEPIPDVLNWIQLFSSRLKQHQRDELILFFTWFRSRHKFFFRLFSCHQLNGGSALIYYFMLFLVPNSFDLREMTMSSKVYKKTEFFFTSFRVMGCEGT